MQLKCKKKMCAVYGEGAVTECVKSGLWVSCRKFLAGWCSMVGYTSWSWCNQIETLIDNNQPYTTWEIADIFKIFKSIKLLVKMKDASLILWKKPYILFGQPNTNIFFCCPCSFMGRHFSGQGINCSPATCPCWWVRLLLVCDFPHSGGWWVLV